MRSVEAEKRVTSNTPTSVAKSDIEEAANRRAIRVHIHRRVSANR